MTALGTALGSPADLSRLMGLPYVVTDEQWAAISAPLAPAVVIAGAGSGKTSVMAARVVYLVATGQVRPDQVLGLTFTTKATSELASRVTGALAEAGLLDAVDDEGDLLEPTVSTYHSYAAALLSEHGLRLGHEPDTRLVGDGARFQLAGRVVRRHRRPVAHLSDSPSHAISYLLQLDASMAEHLVTPDQLRDHCARERPLFEAALDRARAKKTLEKVLLKLAEREELLHLVESYRAEKQRLGLMDFSDQIALGARLANEVPEVGAAERERFRVVLLDEYQDTSVAQALMLSGLFSGPDAERGRGHAVTAVGDPNQAIYGWRGASVSNILEFARHFPGRDGGAVDQYTLSVNQRSDRRILATANALAAPLYAGLRERGIATRELDAKPDAGDGDVGVVVHETYPHELAWLADEVSQAQAAGTPYREIGVLTRDNQTAADCFDALAAREIPVEIVGLSGLLRLPEVVDVVATLTLLHDVTANAELLSLLAGPRWAVGPRDLALLGRRAKDLVGGHAREVGRRTLEEELDASVADADPAEVLSLGDALDDPGDPDRYPYSAQARERFALLSEELRALRAHAGEPPLDLVRRVIDTIGIDVELASSASPAAAARRDNLDLFVNAVAEFTSIDGAVSLPSLLAWIEAEEELGRGLEVATPTEADSVKLLTVHRAKGLEWDVVFLVGVCAERFPVTKMRSQWTTASWALPNDLRGDAADQPRLPERTHQGVEAMHEEARALQREEELRLGYVAFTRARHQLWVSSYLWRESRATATGPSPYQVTARDAAAGWGGSPVSWYDAPPKGTPNPLRETPREVSWPVEIGTLEARRRREAAELVRAVRAEPGEGGSPAEAEVGPPLSAHDAEVVARWDADLERVLTEARAEVAEEVVVPRPASLSATALARLREDPERFARDLARPMPRRPSPAARLGRRFHDWLESRHGQLGLLDPDELPGRAEGDLVDESDLEALRAAFERGRFADLDPRAVEAPFVLVLRGRRGDQVLRGRIDAVFDDPARGPDHYLLVDWKTTRSEDADPLQLAIYRVAWAELMGVPVERVRAGFYFVRTDRLVVPDDLPDRARLEELVG